MIIAQRLCLRRPTVSQRISRQEAARDVQQLSEKFIANFVQQWNLIRCVLHQDRDVDERRGENLQVEDEDG